MAMQGAKTETKPSSFSQDTADLTIAERLGLLVPERQRSESARRCKIAPRTFASYFEGTIPTVPKLVQIAEGLSVNLLWLATGKGPLYPDNDNYDADGTFSADSMVFTPIASKNARSGRAEAIGATDDERFSLENSDLVSIPKYSEVRPSAGEGAVAASDMRTSFVAFNRYWLRDIGVNPIFASILVAKGDSMYPTIPDGSPMLVDTSKTEIHHGCIYAFDLDGDLMVKRIERLPDGTIDLISDNKDRYPIRNVSRDRLGQMNVIGRVFSAVRTF